MLALRCPGRAEGTRAVVFKITAYAEQLLKDPDLLRDSWPEEVLAMLANWIGKSDGAEVQFKVQGRSEMLTVFTTRPDMCLFGRNVHGAGAPQAIPLTQALAHTPRKRKSNAGRLDRDPARTQDVTARKPLDKNGFFLDAYAINPVTQKPVPIWVADYVLMDYGTGAIMAVPAHDQRDYEFAQKYKIPVIEVVKPATAPPPGAAFEAEGTMINSGEFNGLASTDAKRKIAVWLKEHSMSASRP